MKIILLFGKPDTGKTTTMHYVFNKITENGAKNILSPKKRIGKNDDFECIVKYKNKKVAIFSEGDYLNCCYEAIIKYSNADYLLLAYRDAFKADLAGKIRKYNQHKVIKKIKKQDNEKTSKDIIACIK